MTYGLVGPEKTQHDIIYSYPPVAIPKPQAVKSIQLMREIGGKTESVTDVIKGKALEAVANWGGNRSDRESFGQKQEGRLSRQR